MQHFATDYMCSIKPAVKQALATLIAVNVDVVLDTAALQASATDLEGPTPMQPLHCVQLGEGLVFRHTLHSNYILH